MDFIIVFLGDLRCVLFFWWKMGSLWIFTAQKFGRIQDINLKALVRELKALVSGLSDGSDSH